VRHDTRHEMAVVAEQCVAADRGQAGRVISVRRRSARRGSGNLC
jgi:hypothetical protein